MRDTWTPLPEVERARRRREQVCVCACRARALLSLSLSLTHPPTHILSRSLIFPPFSSSLIVRHGESVGDVEEDVAQGIRGVLLDDVGG